MRISVPSWVIPGTYAENLSFLSEQQDIDTVELLFFLYDGETRALLDAEWDLIRSFASRFRFTAHLPDKLDASHEELVERLSPLVDHFIVHPSPAQDAEKLAKTLSAWIGAYERDRKNRFLLENIHPGRLEALMPLLPDCGLCLDTGHLLLQQGNPANFFKHNAARIGEMRLHTLDEAAAKADGRLRDHRSLKPGEAWLESLVPHLRSFEGVVNLEVFSWTEAERSLTTLREYDLLPKRKSN